MFFGAGSMGVLPVPPIPPPFRPPSPVPLLPSSLSRTPKPPTRASRRARPLLRQGRVPCPRQPIYFADDDLEPAERFVQAVVAPNSDFAGRTIGQIDFRRRFGAIVLSLWRPGGWQPQELAQTALEPGDVLVFQGDGVALGRVAADRGFLMLVPFQVERRVRRRAPVAATIVLATVLAAAFGVPRSPDSRAPQRSSSVAASPPARPIGPSTSASSSSSPAPSPSVPRWSRAAPPR